MALALFFFMIYAILGVTTWNGKIHYRCYETPWPITDNKGGLIWNVHATDNRLCDPDVCPPI